MAKTKKQENVPERVADWEINAKPLPIGQVEIDQAWSFILQHHDAVMGGDVAGAAKAIKAYDALVIHLNGGTHFGSYGGDDRPGPYLLKKLAAKITIEEMRFNDYYESDWVIQGLALMQDGNPRPGQHVRLKANGECQVGLVVELDEVNVPPGNIMIALMTGKSTSRSVPGIIIGIVPVSHVEVMSHDQLAKARSLGRYLTPAMVDAYVATQAVFTGENMIAEYSYDSNYGWRFKTQ